jgi:hypothetical protein
MNFGDIQLNKKESKKYNKVIHGNSQYLNKLSESESEYNSNFKRKSITSKIKKSIKGVNQSSIQVRGRSSLASIKGVV